MSSDTAISVRGLSKSYTIRHNAQTPTTLAESIMQRLRHPLAGGTRETFWALKDVSFDVKRGEVVGIIGRNGAGKSTLLKILSRITAPSEGEIVLNGRVGSLLEVGTGFHQELTGRENIFLNGAILGMTRAEIRSQFDAIVDFAGVAQFLDTPVKRYSSGMYVRLAFAVAAHLRSEILIVDEVLAVGDAEFQRKSVGKMKDVAKGGRTVLMVSHNLGLVASTCNHGIVLHKGRVYVTGPCGEAINAYDALGRSLSGKDERRLATAELIVNDVSCWQRGVHTQSVDVRSPFVISVSFTLPAPLQNPRLFIMLYDEHRTPLFGSSNVDADEQPVGTLAAGDYVARVNVPSKILKAGEVRVSLGADRRKDRVIAHFEDVLSITVFDGSGDPESERHRRPGVVAPVLEWSLRRVESVAEVVAGRA